MPATTPKAAAAPASARTRSPMASARAEFPPACYWRRWCEDAAAAVFPAADDAAAPPLPQVRPQAQAGDDPAAAYRVLIVEDDRSQALFAESVLNGTGMQARVVAVASEVIVTMEEFSPDLVLMDLHMPGMSGTELTTMIREHAAFAHTPIVFLTGDADPERQFEALDVGADDFLTKPVRPRHLIAAVQSRVRRARMLQRHRSGEGRHPISGLFTRTYLLQRLALTIPGPLQGAIYFVEIEGMGALRDRFGYAAIETVLVEAGRQVGELAGDSPAARLNDNTFLIFSPDMAETGLLEWASTLRDGIGRHVFAIDGEPLRLRVLVGCTALAHGYRDASTALAAAEEALRLARMLPAGVAAHAPPAVDDDANAAGERVNLIHDAIAGNGFELAYQPIVAVVGGDEAQYQTLLRLRDGNGGLHTAAEILPLADAADILHEVDRRVLLLALDMLRSRRRAAKPVRLFVSQSVRSLTRDGQTEWLLEALAAHEIDGQSLVLDVRQDDALIHALALQEFCNTLVPAGVQFCLGQYRSGREADALLTQLPLGFVRLAARYSNGLEDSAIRDEMRAAIERAHLLGLRVVGQQVEDPQAAATLWMSGVDYIQGNLVQRASDTLDFDFMHAVL